MYAGDAPLAERRAAALALDRDLLRDLLGAEELRELIDADVLADLELELQRLVEGRAGPRRRRGCTTSSGCSARCRSTSSGLRSVDGAPGEGLGRPARRRAARLPRVDRRGGARCARPRTPAACATRSASPCPSACPAACTESVPDPVLDLVARYAAHPRPVPRAARRRPLRHGRRSRCARALERARARGPGRARRVPARRRRAGVVRRRRAPPAPAPVAGRAPQGGRAGRRRHARPLPARAGTASAPTAGASTRSSTWWPSSRARRWSRRRSTATSSGRACPSTSRPTSTPCARRATWCGWAPGAIGSTDGRIRLAFRDQAGLLLSAGRGLRARRRSTPPCSTHLDAARRVVLGRPHPRRPAGRPALRRPHRARRAVGPRVGGARHQRLAGPAARLRRHRRAPLGRPVARRGAARAVARGPGRLARLGPPAGAGRWSLVAPLLEPLPTATEAAHARALQLLERYGVLTREAALGEGAEGGFAGVYPVLKALEERGQVRRGYFVAGLGRRAVRGAGRRRPAPRRARATTTTPPIVLAATDPAQPFGAAIPWPESAGRPARAAGALVVLAGRRRARLPRAGRPQGAALPGRPPRTTAGPTRSAGSWTPAASGRWRSGRSTASTCTRPRPEVRDALQRRRLPAGLQGLVEAVTAP